MPERHGSLRIEHDPEADAVYVPFAPSGTIRAQRARTRRLDRRRFVDETADGTVLGVEILAVSEGADLTGLPRADEIAAALRRHGLKVLTPAT
jgi:uncharacterized protein YuzE